MAEGGGIPREQLPSATCLLRWVLLVAPELVLSEMTAHTAGERERIHRMTIWNVGNAAVADETHRIGDNARRLEGLGFSADLPVLMFVAQDAVDKTPEWLPDHEEQLRECTTMSWSCWTVATTCTGPAPRRSPRQLQTSWQSTASRADAELAGSATAG